MINTIQTNEFSKFHNLKKFEINTLNKNDYNSSSLGHCLRVKLNRAAIMQFLENLENYALENYKEKIKVIDYAKNGKIDLNMMTYDPYHTDPKTSKLLYNQFKKLRIVEKSIFLLR